MTQNTQPKRHVKFNFDNVFANGSAAPAKSNSHRGRSTYSADEVDALRQESFAQGKTAAATEAAAIHAKALNTISLSLNVIINKFDATLTDLRHDGALLALAVGKKLAETSMAALPLQEVQSLIAGCMQKLHSEPRLVVRVPPELADPLKPQIDSLAEKNGYTGRVIILVDQALTGEDCRIEWADGGIEHNMAETLGEIEQHVARWCAESPMSKVS